MNDDFDNAQTDKEMLEKSKEVLSWADSLGFKIVEERGLRRYVPTKPGYGLNRNATESEVALWDALVSAHRDA